MPPTCWASAFAKLLPLRVGKVRRCALLGARVACEAVGPDGRVVLQQWLAHTTAPRVATSDRRRLDFVEYRAMARGEALCCDATLVSMPAAKTEPITATPGWRSTLPGKRRVVDGAAGQQPARQRQVGSRRQAACPPGAGLRF